MGLLSHSSLRVRYCAAFTKGQLSDHSYRGGELADLNSFDFLADTSEIDISENRCNNRLMPLQWTMTNIADQVDHETRESRTDSCPCARERSVS